MLLSTPISVAKSPPSSLSVNVNSDTACSLQSSTVTVSGMYTYV